MLIKCTKQQKPSPYTKFATRKDRKYDSVLRYFAFTNEWRATVKRPTKYRIRNTREFFNSQRRGEISSAFLRRVSYRLAECEILVSAFRMTNVVIIYIMHYRQNIFTSSQMSFPNIVHGYQKYCYHVNSIELKAHYVIITTCVNHDKFQIYIKILIFNI